MTAGEDQLPLLPGRAWAALRHWYGENGRHWLPWRHDTGPWEILLAEVLLHRTRADAVASLHSSLVRDFPSPGEVVNNPAEWFRQTWGMGLHWRSEQFLRACQVLVEDHGGEVPSDRKALLALPGIGQYVAGAVRCFGFGQSEILVDSNTIRLAGRIGGIQIPPGAHRTRRVRNLVGRLGPQGKPPGPGDNYALLDLAGILCVTGEPLCESCPVRPWCETGQSSN